MRQFLPFFALLFLPLCWLATDPSRAADDGLAALVQVLAEVDDAAVQLDLLAGMRDGLEGRKNVPMPEGWEKAYARLSKSADAKVRENAQALAIVFGDPAAIDALRATALAAKTPAAERNAALQVLIDKGLPNFAPTLQQLLVDAAVRRTALRGLAAFSDEQTPATILARYADFSNEEKQDALATLASRREYAVALIDALETKRVPRSDLLPVLARQVHALGDKQLSVRLKECWGDVRETPQDKLARIAKYKQELTESRLAAANLSNGKRVFQKTCQQCHLLYGEGAKIGPDLTGSNRANLEYVLINVIDPSAAIAREYKMNIVTTTDGRVLTGMIVERSGDRVTLQTVNERIVLVEADIDELVESPLSMMPDGQFEALPEEDVRDLVAYLATKKPLE